MKINDFFPNIYCINLPHRTDRLLDVSQEFLKNDIDVDIVEAEYIEDNGRLGLIKTYAKLFKNAIVESVSEIVVFEDDVTFEYSPNDVINDVIEQLPPDFDILYLSGTPVKECLPFSDNLNVVTRCFGLFAVVFNAKVFTEIQEHCEKTTECININGSIDVWIADNIQPRGKCFITNPFMANQKKSYSNIENGEREYRIIKILYDRFVK